MRITLKWLIFTAMEILFVAIVPLAIVFVGYGGWGEEATTFKIRFGVLVVAVIVFFIVKKIFISPWVERQRIKAGNLEAQLETENDREKIENIENALKRVRVVETVVNWILPLAFLFLAFLASRAMEKSIVRFSGILGFVGISEVVGFIFGVLAALCVDSRHKRRRR